jgi:hypothetical protein
MEAVTVTEKTKMTMVKLFINENENDLPHFGPFSKNTVIGRYSTVNNYCILDRPQAHNAIPGSS